MKLHIITSVAASAAMALNLSACATAGSSAKDVNALVKTLQDDKNCDRVRDIDIGGGGGQLGGEAHASFKEHSECGAGHGSKGPVVGTTVVPATAPSTPLAAAPPT